MNINFPLILIIAAFITGVVALVDKLFLAKKRARQAKRPVLIDYCYSLWPVLLIVLVVRSFVVDPWRIPSGSLEPTLLTGDFIVVNKFAYGLRLPVLGTKILNVGEPKTGDIAVFSSTIHPYLIKRVIGVPGDHISYINKILYVNGREATQWPLNYELDSAGNGMLLSAQRVRENLLGMTHDIYLIPQAPAVDFTDVVVPKGSYFVMGDNRDLSDDSRYWGFVPEKALVGKAFLVLFSWDSSKMHVRWSRIFNYVYHYK